MITQGLSKRAAPKENPPRRAAKIDMARRMQYDICASKERATVVSPQGGDRMDIAETIALLMLVLAAIKLGIDLKK